MCTCGRGGELLIETRCYIARAFEGVLGQLDGLIGWECVFLDRMRLEERPDLMGVHVWFRSIFGFP